MDRPFLINHRILIFHIFSFFVFLTASSKYSFVLTYLSFQTSLQKLIALPHKKYSEYLLNLSVAQDSDSFEIPLQLKELSSYLGTTPETLSRKLRALEKQEIIRRQRRTITILKKQKLKTDATSIG